MKGQGQGGKSKLVADFCGNGPARYAYFGAGHRQ